MTKTISETRGKIGDKKNKKEGKKEGKGQLENPVKTALLSAAALMKDVMSSSDSRSIRLCLNLKNKLEEIEKEYGVSLI
jgi:hypothetical protein